MEFERPTGWRKGQTIFNFLWWLRDKKGCPTEYVGGHGGSPARVEGRMADPFHIPDNKFDELWAEFLEHYKKADEQF
jgi:hypothetical protein